jgi:hypothetical protein
MKATKMTTISASDNAFNKTALFNHFAGTSFTDFDSCKKYNFQFIFDMVNKLTPSETLCILNKIESLL